MCVSITLWSPGVNSNRRPTLAQASTGQHKQGGLHSIQATQDTSRERSSRCLAEGPVRPGSGRAFFSAPSLGLLSSVPLVGVPTYSRCCVFFVSVSYEELFGFLGRCEAMRSGVSAGGPRLRARVSVHQPRTGRLTNVRHRGLEQLFDHS